MAFLSARLVKLHEPGPMPMVTYRVSCRLFSKCFASDSCNLRNKRLDVRHVSHIRRAAVVIKPPHLSRRPVFSRPVSQPVPRRFDYEFTIEVLFLRFGCS